MTWLEAALFQWVNPKAWAMALTGVAAYTRPEDYSATLAAFVAVLLGLSFPVTAAWTSIGVSLRGWLDRPGVLRWFNRAMAVTLLASLWPIIRDLTG
jgi:threonine/homoserine/homoserine lactone efflux protein